MDKKIIDALKKVFADTKNTTAYVNADGKVVTDLASTIEPYTKVTSAAFEAILKDDVSTPLDMTDTTTEKKNV